MSTDVALRKQIKLDRKRADLQLISEIMRNPVLEIVAGYIIIEALQQIPVTVNGEKIKIIPSLAGTVAEGGILTAVAMQQMAPIAPYLAAGGTDVSKNLLTSLGPLLALLK